VRSSGRSRLRPARPGARPAALALHALGRDREARDRAAEAVAVARRYAAPIETGTALRTLGLLTGDVVMLREAVELLAATAARLEHAGALVELGAALRRGNRRVEAREPLREGLDLAARRGGGALVQQAMAELAAAGARPRSPRRTGLEALSPSERRVAQLAATGMTNRDIAQVLFVTTKTVEVHLSGAYRKLGVASRAELPAVLG
jgi:DNA-binding CsgD family transcriptional regulator